MVVCQTQSMSSSRSNRNADAADLEELACIKEIQSVPMRIPIHRSTHLKIPNAPPSNLLMTLLYSGPSNRATLNSRPLIQIRVASLTVSNAIIRQSAHDTSRRGSSGSAMGRASGLSFR
jgi:hypothetical protein